MGLFYNPADTLRNNDVVITSKRTHFDVFTTKWRLFDVITTLLLRHVYMKKYPPDFAESNDKQCDSEAMRRGDAEDVLTLSLRIHSQPAHEYEQGHSYEFCSHRAEDSVEAAPWRRVIDERTLFAIRRGIDGIHAYWKWEQIIFIRRVHVLIVRFRKREKRGWYVLSLSY